METSSWTKRRKIHAGVLTHLDCIHQEMEKMSPEGSIVQNGDDDSLRPLVTGIDNQDALIETEPASGESLDSSVLNTNVQDSESSDQVIANSSVALASPTCHHINSDYISCDADIGPGDGIVENMEIDSGEEEVADICFNDKVAIWSTRNNITHSATSEIMDILRPYHPSLPKDPRTLLKTMRKPNIRDTAGGSYYHAGISSVLNQLIMSDSAFLMTVASIDAIMLQISIDGLPLFKSSNMQFWPILGRMFHETDTDMKLPKQPFIIGIYAGQQKPTNISEYLADFVNEMKTLEVEGLYIQEINKYVRLTLSSVICDAPARAFIKQIKYHSGYSGCDKCVQRGVYLNKVTFPETEAELRTDVQFDEMVDDGHHVGVSPLVELSLGMVSQFPLDYMHLVCMGVMRRLLWLWMKGPVATRCRIGSVAVNAINASIMECQKYLPKEFLRKGRSLEEVDRWKATEFRLFLIYTGPVILMGKLSDAFYKNFLLFFVSIYCLASPSYCQTHCDYAHNLLCLFVKNFGELYGRDMLVYNVHGLVHLAGDVKRFGSLDNFSAFPFESFLGKLKKMLRQPRYPLSQVVRRLSEQRFHEDYNKPNLGNVLKKHHMEGPVTLTYNMYDQYKEIRLPHFVLTTSKCDNCVKIGNHFALVRNILSQPNLQSNALILYQRFQKATNFFTYPLDSSKLGIFKVSDVRDRFDVAPVSSVACKCVLLPCREYFVVIPLLHLNV